MIICGVSAPDLRRVLHAQGYYDADLSVDFDRLLAPVVAGRRLDATIRVGNLASASGDAESVSVVTSLPSSLEFEATSGCEEDPDGFPLCALGEIPLGEERVIGLQARVASSATGMLPLTFVATSPTGDLDPVNDVLSIEVPVAREADFEVRLDNGTSFFVQGELQPLDYLVTVRNRGPSDGRQADVSFQGPVAFQVDDWLCFSDPGVRCTPFGSGALFETVDAERDGEALFIVSGILDPSIEGRLVAQAIVSGAIDAVDFEPANNSAIDRDSIGFFADGFEPIASTPVRARARDVALGDWLVRAPFDAPTQGAKPGTGLAGRVVDGLGRTLALVLERRTEAGIRLQLATVEEGANTLRERSNWLPAAGARFRVHWDSGLVLEVSEAGATHSSIRAASDGGTGPMRLIPAAQWRPVATAQ